MTFSDNNRLMRQPHFLAFHSTFDTIFIAVGLVTALRGAVTDFLSTVTVI